MRNQEVAKIFEEMAELLEVQGANPFRIRAYRNAVQTIEGLTRSLQEVKDESEHGLQNLQGIGKDLAEKIATILATGTHPQLEELRAEIPAGVLQILRIPGLGPKKAALLHKELNITSLDELRQACEQHQVKELKGFGEKTEKLILEGLSQAETSGQRVFLAEALPQVEELAAALGQLKYVQQISPAGSVRRRKETIGDLDLLVETTEPAKVMQALADHSAVTDVLQRGDTKQRVRLRSGLELDLRVIPQGSYGAALQYFTGSKDHNIVIRRMAQERGLKINEYGVYRGEEQIAGNTEEDVYQSLGLQWIPPELRENRGEIERAAQKAPFPKLLELADMQGDLHMHTTATDGHEDITTMIEAARAAGLKYIAITDHSQRVSMARGLNPERLRAHWQEIRRIRENYADIHVLCGIECDILEDASMDLPDDVLAEAEWVIAVLHYGLKQPEAQINKRLLNAIKNPHVCVIGHPSGRLIEKRPPARMNFQQIVKAAADHNVMLEINADPHRLDLDDIHAAEAHAHGIPIVISTDAHSIEGLQNMQYGVYQARRAGLTKPDVANTRPFKEFKKLLKHPIG
ncbi:MAG: DNA polymerase/3'-5' exonuclease PolX [Planctomycetales bacterium]